MEARRIALLAPSITFLLACGNAAPPSTPPTPTTSAPATSASSAAPATAEPPTTAKPHRLLEIQNQCAEVVRVVFGEDPKAPESGQRQIAGDSLINDAPRDAEGKMTVWLLDAKGEPLVKVHVTRGMKRVQIGRSCRSLDAR